MYLGFGKARYGKVEVADDGEHAITVFTRVRYLPLVPRQSYWIGADGSSTEITHHQPSITAGFVRGWSLFAAFGALALAASLRNPWITLAAPVLAVFAVQSWRARHATVQQLRAGEFHRAVYGMRCDPRYLSPAHRALLATQLEERWAALDNNRSPNDIARDGTRDVTEATLAYMLLRLGGLKLTGAAAREHEREAARLLDGDHASSELAAGPFRGLSVTDPR